jgi:hypothetical protein
VEWNTAWSLVGEIVDPKTFVAGRGSVPVERRLSHRYRGFNLAWFRGNKPDGRSRIESFDPETLRFQLQEPREMKIGDRFEVFAPSANWLMHDNTLTGCLQPVVFGSHGSNTSLFRDNLIERGSANATQAVTVTGQFKLIGNQLVGFEERSGAAPAKP